MNNGYNTSHYNNRNSPNETFGIMFRQRNTIKHTKDDNHFLTGSRDSIIKLWNNNDEDVIELKANFENHIDWINDIQVSKKHNMFFSCSNDKTIKIWKIPDFVNNINSNINTNSNNNINNDGLIESYYASLNLNNIHTDYIKSLAYSEKSGYLFTAGFDGKILMMKLDDLLKYPRDLNYYQDYHDFNSNNNHNSVFSVDCDLNGDIILASVYENNIQGFDTRQKRCIMNLRGHKDIVRGIKIHPNGKIALTISSDKSIKIWDLGMHRVLKNWDFHTDAIHSLFINEYFTKLITGSKNGEIYLTDLSKNSYCSIDFIKNENIISIAMNQKNEIFVGTDKSKLLQYSLTPQVNKYSKKSSIYNNNIKSKEIHYTEEFKLQKIPCNKGNASFPSTCIEFTNEIIKYHLLKNKIYILCLTADGRFLIYNILKCEKILDIPLQEDYNINFQKMIEIVSQYDTVTLKSWFTVDIKLGAITITFNKNSCFNNLFNFDEDYLEKILEKTDNLKNLISAKYFNFSILPNESSNFHQTNTNITSPSNNNSKGPISTKNSLNVDNPSSSFNKKDIGMTSLKINNLGQSFIKSLFDTFVNDVLLEIKEYLQKNFYDKKGVLQKNFYESLKNTCTFDSDSKININQDIYLFSCEDDHLKCYAYFKEFKNYVKSIEFIREHSPIETLNGLLKPTYKTGEKIEVVINNERKEFKRKKNGDSNTTNYVDEIEAAHSTTMISLKNWLIKNYICIDNLSRMIIEDYKSKSNQEIDDSIKEKLLDKTFIMNFIDFQILDGVQVKNNETTIGHLRQMLACMSSNLVLYLRYCGINSLIDRRLFNFPRSSNHSTTPKKYQDK